MRLALTVFVMLTGLIAAVYAQEEPPQAVLRIVNRVEFTGNTVLSDDELRKIAGIEEGQLLSTLKLQSAISAIEQAYRERGYAAVVADDVLKGFQETGALALPVIEVKVAEVKIEGLRKTREVVVRRMLEQGPGDLYNIFALRRDAERLFALGIFESVDATLEQTERPEEIIVVWQIDELEKTGYVNFGGSYGATGGLIGSINVVWANFRGRAEHIRLSTSVGSIRGRLGAELFYFNPWIARSTSLSARLFSGPRYRFSQDLAAETDRYFERRTGGQIVAARTLSGSRQFSLGTRYESVDVQNLPLELFALAIGSADGSVAAVSGQLRIDSRDSFTYPTRGGMWSAFIEPARADLDDGGVRWTAKGIGEFQRFIRLDPVAVQPLEGTEGRRPRVIAFRLRAGTSAGDLPFFEQYFLGGTLSLRGYREERFWGENMVLATAEYRQPISRALTAVGFVDVGDAWGSAFQFEPGVATEFRQHGSLSPRAGVGVGIRYTTLLGPLGLDFAWGEEFRTHLVLGQAF
ncbi:MAG: BamA/TamA family outer membrane protein [Armatimonadetes bacterium]|nr:BamA/TamA family outer membrane protein [Armatimonadota bacterium]